MSPTELTLILFVALVLFGPEDLPDVARALGKIVYQTKKIASEVTKEFQDTLEAPSKAVNEVLEEKPKHKKDNNETSSVEEEELLTYEEEELPKKEEMPRKNSNPLADLPSEVVGYPKDETQAGD